MIDISNADRDKIVEYLRAYAAELEKGNRDKTSRISNTCRMALSLARKLEKKPIRPMKENP